MRLFRAEIRVTLVLGLLHFSSQTINNQRPECVHPDRCCSNLDEVSPRYSEERCGQKYVFCSRPCRHGCGDNSWRPSNEAISPRIVGGRGHIELGEHPWQGALLQNTHSHSSLLYLGGVSLIYPRWALTAAHKVCGKIDCRLQVRFGAVNLNRTDRVYRFFQTSVDQIITHPSFNPKSLKNNVALLRLRVPVPIGRYINTICLPHGANWEDERYCGVAGWGKESFHSLFYSPELRSLEVRLIDRQSCEDKIRKYSYSFQLDTSEICAAGEYGEDTCTGDGGSPLVCKVNGRNTQLGLVSKGVRCGTHAPGLYAKVQEYWVEKTIENYLHR